LALIEGLSGGAPALSRLTLARFAELRTGIPTVGVLDPAAQIRDTLLYAPRPAWVSLWPQTACGESIDEFAGFLSPLAPRQIARLYHAGIIT